MALTIEQLKLAKKQAVRESLKNVGNKEFTVNLQNVHTPFDLVDEMLKQLSTNYKFAGKILTYNIEFVEVLIYDYQVDKERIYFLSDCSEKVELAKTHSRYSGVKAYCWDLLNNNKTKINMKFDCVVGNPPYQKQVGETKREPLWDKFVAKSMELVKDDGYVCLVHPSGWRNVEGRYKKSKDLLFSNTLEYLEIHNESDGLTTFGAETRYDWYVVKKSKNDKLTTTIQFQDGTIKELNLIDFPMIPNGSLELLQKMIAKEGEEKVNVLYSRSGYGTDKKHISKDKTDIFRYPCIYTINSNSNPSFHYSSNKDNGHFGVPKVIWSNGRISSIGNYIDHNGEYGLTQFAYAIIDDTKNLENIKKALDSKKYKDFMEDLAVGMLTINYKIISYFRKDFWKDFIDTP